MDIKLYDTVKDSKNNWFRVVEVGKDMCRIKGITVDDKSKPGKARVVTLRDLEVQYKKVNLPPITVTHQEPKPNEKEDVKLAPLPDSIRNEALKKANEKQEKHIEELTNQRDECEREIVDLKERLAKSLEQVIDLKKTISKMSQQHEAEVAALNDQLVEKQDEANAAAKSKEEVLRDRLQYADDLDNDSIVFEEILQLAVLMERSAKSMQEISKMIQSKTEGRI